MKYFVVSRRKVAKATLAFMCLMLPVGLFDLNMDQISGAVNAAVNKINPIYFVYTEEPKMSISFDATWGAEHTAAILETLEAHQVKATFFLTNIWLKEYPDMAKTIAEQGHEIAMHSVTHPHMNELSKEGVIKEITENHQMIKDITGYDAILFRFPFGEYNNQSVSAVQELQYYPVQWSIDSLDWKEEMTVESIKTRVIEKMHKGAIILCHNNGTYTAQAIDGILSQAKQQGYQFIPIGELIYQEGYEVDHQGGQKQSKE